MALSLRDALLHCDVYEGRLSPLRLVAARVQECPRKQAFMSWKKNGQDHI